MQVLGGSLALNAGTRAIPTDHSASRNVAANCLTSLLARVYASAVANHCVGDDDQPRLLGIVLSPRIVVVRGRRVCLLSCVGRARVGG